MYYITTYPSQMGVITLACDAGGSNLVGLWMEGQKYHGGILSETTVQQDQMRVFGAAKTWLDQYFAGENPDVSEVPLAPAGTEFRQEVWKILCRIPYGQVVTYGSIAKEMAEKMGKKSMSSQAVGGAVGHNPISIMIPCHRVIGSDGSLTGYAGGIHIKEKLLQLEGADMSLIKK